MPAPSPGRRSSSSNSSCALLSFGITSDLDVDSLKGSFTKLDIDSLEGCNSCDFNIFCLVGQDILLEGLVSSWSFGLTIFTF